MKLEELKERIDFHLGVISKLCRKSRRGSALIATFQRSRYPHVYPRDVAAVSKVLAVLSTRREYSRKALQLLGGIAKFIASVQTKKGHWGQKYSISGRDRSIYIQEDNNAMGVIIIANYLLSAARLNKKIKYKNKYVKSIIAGIDYAIENYYNKDTGLFYSTTGIHESTLERGYSIWVNFAYLYALKLIEELGKHPQHKKQLKKFSTFRREFEKNVKDTFIREEVFVAKFDEQFNPDFRPDIILMSPFYFGSDSKKITKKSIDFIRKELWDEELGLLRRYPIIPNDLATHSHAGDGPWIQYSAILAQHYFSVGKIREGNKILNLIDSYATEKGYLPEHVSTEDRFKEFIKNEWKTGIDFRKEFNPEILLPHIDFDRIYEELSLMKSVYEKIKLKCHKGHYKGIIRFGVPLVWSHAEYLMALFIKGKKLRLI